MRSFREFLNERYLGGTYDIGGTNSPFGFPNLDDIRTPGQAAPGQEFLTRYSPNRSAERERLRQDIEISQSDGPIRQLYYEKSVFEKAAALVNQIHAIVKDPNDHLGHRDKVYQNVVYDKNYNILRNVPDAALVGGTSPRLKPTEREFLIARNVIKDNGVTNDIHINVLKKEMQELIPKLAQIERDRSLRMAQAQNRDQNWNRLGATVRGIGQRTLTPTGSIPNFTSNYNS